MPLRARRGARSARRAAAAGGERSDRLRHAVDGVDRARRLEERQPHVLVLLEADRHFLADARRRTGSHADDVRREVDTGILGERDVGDHVRRLEGRVPLVRVHGEADDGAATRHRDGLGGPAPAVRADRRRRVDELSAVVAALDAQHAVGARRPEPLVGRRELRERPQRAPDRSQDPLVHQPLWPLPTTRPYPNIDVNVEGYARCRRRLALVRSARPVHEARPGRVPRPRAAGRGGRRPADVGVRRAPRRPLQRRRRHRPGRHEGELLPRVDGMGPRRGPPRCARPRGRASASSTSAASTRRSSSRARSAWADRTSAWSTTPPSAGWPSRSTTTAWRRSRPTRATGCCRSRSCRRGTSTRACSEARRVAGLGARGVNMTSDPQDLGAPDLASRAWDPFWEVCSRAAAAGPLPHRRQPDRHDVLRPVPVGLPRREHQAGHRRHAALHRQRARRDERDPLGHVRPASRPDRWSRWRAGSGGSPSSSRRSTTRWRRTRPQELAQLEKMPSEYFRSNLYATFWFENNRNKLPDLIEAVGEDRILFETDFPHPTCLYPNPLQTRRDEDGDARAGDPGARSSARTPRALYRL